MRIDRVMGYLQDSGHGTWGFMALNFVKAGIARRSSEAVTLLALPSF